MVVRNINSRTQEAEIGLVTKQVPRQPGLDRETLSQKANKQKTVVFARHSGTLLLIPTKELETGKSL